MACTEETKIELGSGNVFADLGLPDADTHLLKAELVAQIGAVIRSRGLTQKNAGGLMGLSQPDVSRLLSGSFRDFSVDRLFRLLAALGRDVEIVVREPETERAGRVYVEAA